MVLPLLLLFRTQKTSARQEEERAARAAAAEEAAAKKRAARAAEKESGINKKKSKGVSRLKKAHAAAGGEADEEEEGPSRSQRRAEKRAEREEERQVREAEREAADDKQNTREAARRAKEEEREERERQREEERRKKKEEEAKKAQEEYDSWKGMFEVEETGDGGADAQEDEGLLVRFVTTLKRRKRESAFRQQKACCGQVSTLEQLGAEFNMKVADVVSRVRGLEAMGYVTGVIDDRGKFIFVSRDELKAVAKYIQKKGRVRISTLAQESNRLIDLNSHEEVPEEEEEAMETDAKA
eukprot:scaffold75467_cov26-Tisochrysis_lutea.AAC.2